VTRDAATAESPRRRYDLTSAAADYAPWQGAPLRTLVICTQQRSGSTLLGEAMYFAGGMGCPLEYFHSGFRPDFEARFQPADIHAYAATLHELRTDTSGVFSVKLFWQDAIDLVREIAPSEFHWRRNGHAMQLDPDAHRRIFAILANLVPNPTLVFLRRRDTIRQAVSLFMAGRSRQWRQLSPGKGSGARATVAYDFHRIFRFLSTIQRTNTHWTNFFGANGLAHYEMVYEDLESDYQGTLRRFFDALGRQDAAIAAPRLHKQSDIHSEEQLQRFLSEFRHRSGREA